MAAKKKKILLDPAALAEYSASIADRTPGEIREAKRTYLLDAYANYLNIRAACRALLIVLAIASLFPPFLLIFIPAFFGFRSVNRSTHDRILHAAELWKADLGPDYAEVLQKIS